MSPSLISAEHQRLPPLPLSLTSCLVNCEGSSIVPQKTYLMLEAFSLGLFLNRLHSPQKSCYHPYLSPTAEACGRQQALNVWDQVSAYWTQELLFCQVSRSGSVSYIPQVA